MSKLGARQAIIFATLLGIAGFWVLNLNLAIGQTSSPTVREPTSNNSLTINSKLDRNSKKLDNNWYYNSHKFIGKAGEQIVIDLTSKEFNALLILLDPEGKNVANDDNSCGWNNVRITVFLPKTGTYTIVVTTRKAQELGSYQLSRRTALEEDIQLAEAVKLDQQVIQLHKQGNYREAILLGERVLAIKKKVLGKDHPDLATSLNNLAFLYENQGRYSEAESLFHQALEMEKRLLGQENICVATSLNNLAALYKSQGRYAEAEPFFRQALEMYKRLLGQENTYVAASLNNLAVLYQTQGRYDETERLYRQALEMRKHLLGQEHPDVATSLDNLASLYESQGRYAEAEPFFRQALEMYKRLLGQEHPDVATSLDNLASLYESQGRYAEAESLFRQALEMRKHLLGQEHPDVATSLNNLALLYKIQGRYAEAEPLYRQALEIRKRLLGQEHHYVANSLNNLAALYESQGRYAEAEPLYRQALEMHKRLLGTEHPDMARNLSNLANVYESQGRYTEAEPLYHQALEMHKRLLGTEHPDVAIILNNLAVLHKNQGNTVNALNFLTQGLEIEENNLAYNLGAGFERQKRDYIRTISGTTSAIISLNFNSAPNNPKATRLAVNTVLRRKGRILDILTNNLQILRQRLDYTESKKLIDELSNIYNQLATLIYNRPEKLPLDEYRKQVANLEEKAKRKEDELSRSTKVHIKSQPVTLEAIQKLIPSDAALVELVRYKSFNPKEAKNKRFGEARYAAYILTSSGEPQGIDLGEAKVIEQTLTLFRESLRDPSTPTDQVKQSARELDKIIMQPVRKHLGKTRKILISPDGTLNLIPFEALVDENNRYLVENYSFNYLTSGRDLLRLQNSFPSKQPPVIIGDPYFDKPGEPVAINSKNTRSEQTNPTIRFLKGNFPRLEGTAKQAEAIAALLKVNSLIGSQASEANVKQIQSPKILVIGTHGFFQGSTQTTDNQNTFNDNPLLLSGLIFAGYKQQQGGGNEDGILTAQETTLLNLIGTKLAVLSACDTGVGKDTTGEGIYSLRRALVIAGSESQVISLWKVDDSATKDLMVAYFKRILGKEGRSEALRQTQLDMLRVEQYQHPYYWAAFIPSGDWRPMEH